MILTGACLTMAGILLGVTATTLAGYTRVPLQQSLIVGLVAAFMFASGLICLEEAEVPASQAPCTTVR